VLRRNADASTTEAAEHVGTRSVDQVYRQMKKLRGKAVAAAAATAAAVVRQTDDASSSNGGGGGGGTGGSGSDGSSTSGGLKRKQGPEQGAAIDDESAKDKLTQAPQKRAARSHVMREM